MRAQAQSLNLQGLQRDDVGFSQLQRRWLRGQDNGEHETLSHWESDIGDTWSGTGGSCGRVGFQPQCIQ